MAHGIDLNAVNDQLRWSPYSRNREAREDVPWNDRFEYLEPQQDEESLLKSAIGSAEFQAQRLAAHYEGRLILQNENPGQDIPNPQYWSARAAFYMAEYERLEQEEYCRRSRSVTPGYTHPDFFGESELDRAKGHAENAALRLASHPEGKAFLDNEDHGEFSGDPEYWRQKEKEYHNRVLAIPKESALDRARRHAHTVRKKVASFSAGNALLETENHELAEPSVEFWRDMEQHYRTVHKRLQADFWDRWKGTIAGSKGSLLQLSSAAASTSNRRPVTRSCTWRGQEKEKRKITTTACCHDPLTTSSRMRRTRSQTRREHKEAYRLGSTVSTTATAKPHCLECSAGHGPASDSSTPISYKRKTKRLANRHARLPGRSIYLREAGRRLESSEGACAHLNFLQPCVPRTSWRCKRVAARQWQHLSTSDSAYHGIKPISQPLDPISSRLRSRGRPRWQQ